MTKRLQFISCILASVFLSVACSTRPAEPSKPVPVVQVTTKQVNMPADPVVEKTPPATPPKKADVPVPPKTPVKQEVKNPPPVKQDVPAVEKQPETPPPAEVETPTPPAPEVKSIKFRCAFWMKPQKSYDIYVRTKGEFRRCQLFELVFSQEMTPDLEENGMVTVYRKVDGDFLPLFTVDTCGMNNLAAVLLPKFNPDDPQGAYIQILDLDEKKFPKGSLRILNWSKQNIAGDVLFKSEGTRNAFELKCGEYFVTSPIEKNREICEYRFFDVENPSRTIYTSAFSLFDWNQTMLFVLKDDDGDGFDFKMSKVR